MAYLTIEIKSTPYSSLVKMLGPFVKSERLTKRNQWVHHFKNGELMQSYNSVCGIKVRGRIYYGQNHDVSATTQKYMGKWSGRSASQRRAELIDGTARMIDNGFNGYVSTSYSWGPKCSPMFSKRK